MDRLTDRSIPIPPRLVVSKGVKELVHTLGVDALTDILYSHTHTVALASCRADHQLAWAIIDAAHCVRGVQQQVENDLLQLNAIADDWRQIIGQFLAQNHPICLQVARRQRGLPIMSAPLRCRVRDASGLRGIENKKVAPGPSFGSAPETAMMSFDDGAAGRETDTLAVPTQRSGPTGG